MTSRGSGRPAKVRGAKPFRANGTGAKGTATNGTGRNGARVVRPPVTAGFVVACAHCGTELDLEGFTSSLLAAVGVSIASARAERDAGLLHADLRPREQQVLELVADGWQVASIAVHLRISDSTVRKHLQGAYRKLGVGSKAEFLEWIHSASRRHLS